MSFLLPQGLENVRPAFQSAAIELYKCGERHIFGIRIISYQLYCFIIEPHNQFVVILESIAAG